MPINFGMLQQPQAPQNTTQVIQTAPQESAGDDIFSGIKGLLGGVFGKNPVSQANQAVSTTMANSPLQSIAKSILPQGMGGSGQPQTPPNGLLNGFKQAMAEPSNPNMPFGMKTTPNPSPYAPSVPPLKVSQTQMSSNPGDIRAASIAAYQGKSPFAVAQSFLGDGRQQHAEVIQDFFKKSGVGNVNIQNTPWCAGFANAVLKSTGHPGTNSLAARSFLNYGKPTSNPSQGDVVVFSDLTGRNDPVHGHVGFYAGEGSRPGYVKVLGGNQSGSVNIKEYPASKVLGYRVPPTAEELQYRQQQMAQPQQAAQNNAQDMNNGQGMSPQGPASTLSTTPPSYILPPTLHTTTNRPI